MIKALRGFKRFDDDLSHREERRIKTSSSKRRSKRDQSAQPFLNLEDSNGLSPKNEPGRWETLEQDEDADLNQNSFRKSIVPTEIHSNKIPFTVKNGENVIRHDNSRKDMVHAGKGETRKNQISKSTGQKQNSNIFDPFCLEDLENHGSRNEFFDLTESKWDAFSANPKSLEQCDFSEMQEPSPGKRFDSLNLQKCESKRLDDLFEVHTNNVSPKADIFKAEREEEDTGRKSRTEADTISISSFPMRIKPIEFLKKRTVEEDDSYAGDIFLKLDESSHIRSRPSKRESMIETVKEEEDETSDVCLHIETDIQPNVDGIEVVEVETAFSSRKPAEVESMTLEETKPEDRKSINQEDKEDNGEGIHASRDKNLVDKESSPDDDSNCGSVRGRDQDITNCEESQTTTPSQDQASNTSSFSENIKEGKIPGTSKSLIDEAHTEQSPIIEANKTNPLKQLAQFTAPILNMGSISWRDDPIKLAAEKLGISATEEPFEEQLQVPLQVRVKRKSLKVFEDPQKNNGHNSIQAHSKNRKEEKKNGKLVSPSTGSLLDNATEVSDLYSSSTSSGSSSVSKLHLETIDLKSVNSGSVSSLSFQGKVTSKGSEDDSRSAEARHQGSPAKRKSRQKMKIPRGPTRRTESDFASVTEQPEKHIQTKKEGTKPLGATANEIKMINKFLAIAGPEFDGSSLTIEKREQIHNKALREGLTEQFINKMLDQSAGIILWEQTSSFSDDRSETTEAIKVNAFSPSVSNRTGRTLRTKDTIDDNTKITTETSFSEDVTLDEDGFVRKSPKEDPFSCLKNIFWMESSNVVGDDMTENILAVMSADSESLYSRKKQPRR